ncbi:MAG: response regulator [Oligoflexia bacterium]|nr:response regulator [Oligoflexia bacterium]
MARVLVIDDEEGLRESIQFALASRHEVQVAEGGRTALELIRGAEAGQRPFDAILCDLMMPELSGMALFAVLEKENPRAAQRMIFMSGGAVTTESRQFLTGLEEGRVISKPFTLKDVRAAVERKISLG